MPQTDSLETAQSMLPENFSTDGMIDYLSSDMVMGWAKDALNFGIRVVLAIVAFIIGRWIAHKIIKKVDKLMKKKSFDPAMVKFFDSLLNMALMIALFIIAAGILGVSAVSFAALLGATGLAIGAALSGQLQNLAGGVIILITKPFRIGDYVQATGLEGVVSNISIFHTSLTTVDNKVHRIPNGLLSTSSITNFTEEKMRRCDIVMTVEYDTPFEKVEEVARRIANEKKLVLKDQPIDVFLVEMADSSVNIALRVWCRTEDYWDLYFDLNKTIYAECNKEGIGFAFPQLTVHQAK